MRRQKIGEEMKEPRQRIPVGVSFDNVYVLSLV